jgi:hypothetical protein
VGVVSRSSVAPGQRSLDGLDWLARVGVSPLEPWGLVMGWRRTVTYDHARRLAAAGLVRTVPMIRGSGSLAVLTAAGAARVGYPANWAPRSVAPSTWAHASACAWVSAWLQLRGHQWWSEREILDDAFWRRDVRFRDRRGTARVTHRPDLGLRIAGRPAAIEVELQRKTRARLIGILNMYAEHSDGDNAPLYGVLYVCDRADVADAVKRAAMDAGLHAPTLSFRALQEVVEQTRAAACPREAAGRDGLGATR